MADIVSSLFLASHVQNLHRIHELLPDTVQTLHGLLFRLFAPLRIFLQFFRSAGKQTAIGPIASRSGADHIVFQLINLFSGNIRHAAAQKMKHRIIGKVLNIQLQCALDIFDHGIQHDSSGTVQETWDLQLSEFCFHIGSVSFQISDDHGNVPVGHPLLSDQVPDVQRCLVDFLSGGKGFKHMDLLLFSRIRFILIPEQILFQIV